MAAYSKTSARRIKEDMSAELNHAMEELKTTALRIKSERDRMYATLLAIQCFLEDREDIKDGPEGRQLPNDWMRLAMLVREGLGQ